MKQNNKLGESMAEADKTPDDATEDGEEEKPKGKKKLILIIGVVVLLVAVAAGLKFMGILGGGEEPPATEEHKDDGRKAKDDGKAKAKDDSHGKDGKAKAKDADGKAKDDGHGGGDYSGAVTYLPIPDMLVNLNSSGRKVRYLKLKVNLEIHQGKDEHVKGFIPRIVDLFQSYLRGLRVEDLKAQSTMHRLREELLERVHEVLDDDSVTDILFGEILVQ